MERKKRTELAEWVSTKTREMGADQSSVFISNSRKIEIEYRDGKIEKLKESTQNSLSLNLYVENKYSSHGTNNLERKNLEKFIEKTIAMTRYLSKDKFRSLPEEKFYKGRENIDLKLYDPEYINIDTDRKVKISEEIESAAKGRSDKLISVTAGYSDTFSESVLVNSNGFTGERTSTSFSCGAEATVKDGDKGRPEDYYYSNSRFFKKLPPPEILGKKAVDYALRKIGQSKISSGNFDMIVENRSAGKLLNALYGPMSASAIQQKRSFMEGKIGKKIGSEKLSIIDDPFIPEGLGSRLFDGEGITSKKRTIIKNGILKEYYIDNYYGKKLGIEPNTGSSSNLVFENGERSQEDIIKDIDKGILVTNFIGGNSNPATGDFSYGIMGILIEKGVLTKPVNEMNITGNIAELWKKLEEVGNDPYPYSSWRTPSLMFPNIHFSGR